MKLLQAFHQQDEPGGLVWIPTGYSFDFDDIVFYKHKGSRTFEEVAAQADLIITAPHATAAFPREIASFVDPNLTQRKQFDYSDINTAFIGRAWAELDERVIYIENPHPRLIFDQNRPRPSDAASQLAEAFSRLSAATSEKPASLTGVDSIRPITFSGDPVLTPPTSPEEISRMASIWLEVADRGAFVYSKIRDQVIETVFEKKMARLTGLDLEKAFIKNFNSACMLHIHSLHDTMGTKTRKDGAINVERQESERMPALVSLANRGDDQGNPRFNSAGALPESDAITMQPKELQQLANCYGRAFNLSGEDFTSSVYINRPYFGGLEVQIAGHRNFKLAARGIVHHPIGGVLSLRISAYQSEFLREALMGKQATMSIQAPGKDWPEVNSQHVFEFAEKCAAAHDLIRLWSEM